MTRGDLDARGSEMHSVTVQGRYRVLAPGVTSGEVVTYAAEDLVSGGRLTLSVLRGPATADADFVTAVREQAYRLAKPVCSHPSLVRVVDVGTTDEGELFVALEPIVGPSLREMLDERGALDAQEGLRLAIQIGEGLETLHRNGIVHGELRPEAVVVVKGEDGSDAVKLAGVELTAARRTAVGLRTRDTTIAPYLAPEQIARDETTEAADVHALGLLLLELLTGHRPGRASGRSTSEVSPAIARIVAMAIDSAPGRRYSSISLMVNDMWTIEHEPSPARARAAGSPAALGQRRPTARRRARSDVGMATALVIGLLLVGVTAWVVHADRFARRTTQTQSEPAVEAPPATSPDPGPPPASAPSEPVRSGPPSPEGLAPAPPTSAKQATVGAVARTLRAVSRPSERGERGAQPAADSGDGTAIIDWLLKGDRAKD